MLLTKMHSKMASKALLSSSLFMLLLLFGCTNTSLAAFVSTTTTTTCPTTTATCRLLHRTNTADFRKASTVSRMSMSNSNHNNSNNLSAAARERRDEEKRVQQRKQDVVIGKTSAKPQAKDFPLNPTATEESYLRQASRDEQVVFQETERGLQALKLLDLPKANEAFDKVFNVKPSAYLWQAGVCKFYLGDLIRAEQIFRQSAEFYEMRFGQVASEERIWQMACLLKMRSEGTELPQVEKEKEESTEKEEEEDLMPETRKVFRIAHDLFSASLRKDVSKVVLARAKLRSICSLDGRDIKMHKVTAWFYLGLHYDCLLEYEEAKECIKAALRTCPSMGNGSDLIHTLPALHMAQRDWYDQDEFEPEMNSDEQLEQTDSSTSANSDSARQNGNSNSSSTSPVVINSIKKSVAKLKYVEMQEALRNRGLKAYGSKKELREMLFQSLLQDSGLDDC